MTTRTLTTSRAARLQLRDLIELARNAASLLHSKEEALRREGTRLEGHATRTAQQWQETFEKAVVWLMRARALGAGPELDAARRDHAQPAVVTIAWQAAMGVTYPGEVKCVPGLAPDLSSTAAVVAAAAAYQDALIAAAQHAAAETARSRLEAELADTRRRRRAIEERLEPRLEHQLRQIDRELDERDREAALRTQLAVKRRGSRR